VNFDELLDMYVHAETIFLATEEEVRIQVQAAHLMAKAAEKSPSGPRSPGSPGSASSPKSGPKDERE